MLSLPASNAEHYCWLRGGPVLAGPAGCESVGAAPHSSHPAMLTNLGALLQAVGAPVLPGHPRKQPQHHCSRGCNSVQGARALNKTFQQRAHSSRPANSTQSLKPTQIPGSLAQTLPRPPAPSRPRSSPAEPPWAVPWPAWAAWQRTQTRCWTLHRHSRVAAHLGAAGQEEYLCKWWYCETEASEQQHTHLKLPPK